MRYALLIGAPDDDPRLPFDPTPSLDAIEGLLVELGGWTIRRLEGSAASRGGILAGLAALERTVDRDDACLVYFFGHGGTVEFTDVPAPLGQRTVSYLVPARLGGRQSFEEVLDVELSLSFARIDAICSNVSVLLDCCFAARTVRGPERRLVKSPPWVHALAERTRNCDDWLTAESHPRIVRLTASSASRCAYGERREGGVIGRLALGVIATIREARALGPEHLERLTWDALAHRVREATILRMRCEDQWVTLAGPSDRVVFSRRRATELPRTVAFVPRRPGEGWIRAGAVHGVELDDEFGLAELTLDEHLRPRWRARARVVAVELNRAVVEVLGEADDLPPGTAAHLLRARTRRLVAIDGPPELAVAVDDSSLIGPAPADATPIFATLRARDRRFEVAAQIDDFAPVTFERPTAAIERLEDWARARTLLELGDRRPPARPPVIRVSWGPAPQAPTRGGSRPSFALDDPSVRLCVGERAHYRIAHAGGNDEWFVSAIEIGVDGRPRLLGTSEPEGHELRAGDVIDLGVRDHCRDQGFELRWPPGIAADRPRPVTVMILASSRPIQLGHLIAEHRRDPLPRPRRRRSDHAENRGHLSEPPPPTGPELIRGWSWVRIRYLLDPRPRNSSARPPG